MPEMWRRRAGALGAALALTMVAAVPAASAAPVAVTTAPGVSTVAGIRLSLPAPSGPLPVGTVSLRLVDRSRPDPWVKGRAYREVMVSVWYPATRAPGHPVSPHLPPLVAADFDATLAPDFLGVRPGQVNWAATRTHARLDAPVRRRSGGYPVVLYSPGYMVPRSLGTLAAEDLASRGYVVVTVDHTYEAAAVEFPGGRLERTRVRADDMDDAMKALDVKVADLRFVLDVITARRAGLPSRLVKALDTTRVAAMGFSMGGAAVARLMYADHRVKAGVNLDGSLFGEVTERGLDAPFLQLAADEHDDPSWVTFRKHRRGWKHDLRLAGAKHYSFTDMQALVPRISDRLGTPSEIVGTVDPVRSVAAQRAYVAAFLDLQLKGRTTRLFDGPSPAFPEMSFLG
ncbi:lipase [Microbispora sp. NPDC046933]|uniref:alpha/beta hydrolase family protein n=1 Tax=Microbispora sp. NPDC046933 TaxID=3155618 RepID=UPI0033EE710C